MKFVLIPFATFSLSISAQAIPQNLLDHFESDKPSCKLYQLEGTTSQGNFCLVNVGFGSRSSAGGSSNSICTPGTLPSGNIIIKNQEGETLFYSKLGSNKELGLESRGKFSYDPSLENVLKKNVSYTFSASSSTVEIQLIADEYEALNVTQVGANFDYEIGPLIEEGSVQRTYDCQIFGPYTFPIDGN